MNLFDVIIVGSGPAGTFAAYMLRTRNVLMLDVGLKPPPSPELNDNIIRLRQTKDDLFKPLIGEEFESLHNIHARKVSLKLKAPYLSYIIKDWEQLAPVSSSTFEGVLSFAAGGLANAWGAGVYRFNSKDLKGFPLTAAELEPYYDLLTSHIGISGQNDDLEAFFGHDDGLLEPMKISRFASDLFGKYCRNRRYFNEKGIFIGYPRLAVLTREHNNRDRYRYENLEFFKPCIPAVYNPAYTLNEMVTSESILYRDGYLVMNYREHEGFVEVFAKQLDTGVVESFRARKLILGAGALSTAKIVLMSNDDYQRRLPFLDNPMSVILLFRLGGIGSKPEIEGSTLTQLNIVCNGPLFEDTLQASLFGTSGPLKSDALFDLPLTLSANRKIIKYVSPSAGAVMLFYPGRFREENYIQLKPDNSLEVSCRNEELGPAEKMLRSAFRKIGFHGAPFLCQYPNMGTSLHYAGMLPMKEGPDRYQTDRRGRLFGTRNVFIVDGACFSGLPAKNLTLTIMANSMRIADHIKSELSGS